MFICFLLYLISGLLLMGVSIPMIQRRIKPNPWYGFRTPKTLSDERIWYAANEYSGKTLFVAGAITSLASVALTPLALLPHVGLDAYTIGCLIALMGSLTWSVIISFKYLSKL